jgi:hypothetical protein
MEDWKSRFKITANVRGHNGLLPYRSVDDFTSFIEGIKAWRATENAAGRPNSLADFYSTHGICPTCAGNGVVCVGASEPTSEREVEICEEEGRDDLPVYEVCPKCLGSGTTPPSSPAEFRED